MFTPNHKIMAANKFIYIHFSLYFLLINKYTIDALEQIYNLLLNIFGKIIFRAKIMRVVSFKRKTKNEFTIKIIQIKFIYNTCQHLLRINRY